VNVSSGSSDYDFVKSGTENDGAFHGNKPWMKHLLPAIESIAICLVGWCLMALSAQIGYMDVSNMSYGARDKCIP